MKIAILLKNGPCTDEAVRALKTAADMVDQGHTVSLCLLQEAVRFCGPGVSAPQFQDFRELTKKDLEICVLTSDAVLRGINLTSADQGILEGTYESLVDLMASCDHVVGIL